MFFGEDGQEWMQYAHKFATQKGQLGNPYELFGEMPLKHHIKNSTRLDLIDYFLLLTHGPFNYRAAISLPTTAFGLVLKFI